MSTRLYLPTTVEGLAELVASGTLPAERVSPEGPVRAEGAEEEDEYAALMTAADLSAALAVERGLPGARRVVVVVESGAGSGAEPTSVPRREVVAVHLDTEDRDADADPDDDLAWFAPEELEHLV